MIQRLSSIRLTYYALWILVLVLALGTGLSLNQKEIFKALNHGGLYTWLAMAWQDYPLAAVWFLALGLIAVCLLANGICCCLSRQLVPALKTRGLRQWLFFILHCLFLGVLACHGLALGLSQKQSQVTLFPGQTSSFTPYTVQVKEVIFSDDPALLKASKQQQRGLMTRDRVGLDHNWATLALVKDGGRPSLHPVFMLSPLREGFFQATITDFVIDPDSEQPGVVLNFTHNYFNVLFFSIYGIMIIVLAGFTCLTWKPNKQP